MYLVLSALTSSPISLVAATKADYGTRNYDTADLHIIMSRMFVLILSLSSDVSTLLPREVCIMK